MTQTHNLHISGANPLCQATKWHLNNSWTVKTDEQNDAWVDPSKHWTRKQQLNQKIDKLLHF